MFLRASLILAAGAAALAVPASAQHLTRSGGILGTSVAYDLTEGTPGGFYALGVSVAEGPTPLALFEPGNPYVLDLGLELVSIWKLGGFSGTGTAGTAYPLPANPNFNGAPLWAQYLELPPPSFSLGPVSNRVGVTLGTVGSKHNTIGENVSEYYAHTSVTLNDGRVLQTGGYMVVGQIDTFSVFDPQTEEFSMVAGTMQNYRTQHTATALDDGRVLIVGGADATDNVYATVDIWDPATGTCTPGPPMSVKRARHTATKLPDGRVLIAGGIGSFTGDLLSALDSTEKTCEIFDPQTDTWSPAASLPKPRVGHAASLLGDGRVLVTGGVTVTTFIIPLPELSTSCVRYDAGSDQWLDTASMPFRTALHGQITINNGDGMVVGGADGQLLLQNIYPIASTAVYSAGGNTWSQTADLNYARAVPSVLNTGLQLVVVSGFSSMDLLSLQGTPVGQYESAPAYPLVWNSQGTMVAPREHSQSVLYDGGLRIVTSGMASDAAGPVPGDLSAEIFIP